MERVWVTRLRWRMRGAWLWPCFGVLTLVDALLLWRLPPFGDGPRTYVAALLVAGFVNLVLVAAAAPPAGRALRRRRRDLPRQIADNYAGTALVGIAAVALLAGGILHRPTAAAERDAAALAALQSRDYVVHQGDREYRTRLAELDVMRLEEDVYRSCVPGPDPRRWLCLFVNTQQRPAGIIRDPDEVPNSAYRVHGGFR